MYYVIAAFFVEIIFIIYIFNACCVLHLYWQGLLRWKKWWTNSAFGISYGDVYVTNSKMPRMKSHDQHLSGPVHDTGHYIRNGADLGRRDSLLAIWQYPPKIFERFQIFLILANDMLNFFSSSTSHQWCHFASPNYTANILILLCYAYDDNPPIQFQFWLSF